MPSVYTIPLVRIALSLNKPAIDQFFDGGKIRYVTVGLTDDGIRLRPETHLATDWTVEIAHRGQGKRGGAKIILQGTAVFQLGERFRNPYGNPFFMLTKKPSNSWIDVAPYNGERREPPKFAPHMRVGEAPKIPGQYSESLVQHLFETESVEFFREVLEAQEILSRQENLLGSGRQSKVTSDAMLRMRLFRGLVQKIMPAENAYVTKRILAIGSLIDQCLSHIDSHIGLIQDLANIDQRTLADAESNSMNKWHDHIQQTANLRSKLQQYRNDIQEFVGTNVEDNLSEMTCDSADC